MKKHFLGQAWPNGKSVGLVTRGCGFGDYTIIQSITSSEMCSLHLTHPRARTPGAVGSQCSGAWGAVEGSVPCSRVSPQSWTIPAGAEIRTLNLRLQV